MKIKLDDIYRATLATHTGNEGWIGIEPTGKSYHVIAPVDTQIAKGVMACNLPNDGTPFGGYSNWIYVRCCPYNSNCDDDILRFDQARKNLADVISRLSAYGISVDVDERPRSALQPCISTGISFKCKKIFCRSCNRSWNQPSEVLDDPDLDHFRYRANIDNFNDGVFLFRHSCGGQVELPVATLVRARTTIRSLAGSRACPGLCYYETAMPSCDALCEGSTYRKLAGAISKRRSKRDERQNLAE